MQRSANVESRYLEASKSRGNFVLSGVCRANLHTPAELLKKITCHEIVTLRRGVICPTKQNYSLRNGFFTDG